MLKIRKFDWKKDIKHICDFHKEHVKLNFPDSKYKEKLFRQSLKKKYREKPNELFIFEIKDSIAGFLWLDIMYDPYKEIQYGYIHYIHLAESFRGKGLGKKLMGFAFTYFRKKNIKEIRLGTHISNTSAVKFYKKLDFKEDRLILKKNV